MNDSNKLSKNKIGISKEKKTVKTFHEFHWSSLLIGRI